MRKILLLVVLCLALVGFREPQTKMDRDTFWAIIETVRGHSVTDLEVQQGALHSELEKCTNEEIAQFTWIARLYASAAAMNEGICYACQLLADYDASWDRDDKAVDFGYWLVLQGRQVYTEAMADPDRLANERIFACTDYFFPQMLLTAMQIHESRTDENFFHFVERENGFDDTMETTVIEAMLRVLLEGMDIFDVSILDEDDWDNSFERQFPGLTEYYNQRKTVLEL